MRISFAPTWDHHILYGFEYNLGDAHILRSIQELEASGCYAHMVTQTSGTGNYLITHNSMTGTCVSVSVGDGMDNRAFIPHSYSTVYLPNLGEGMFTN